MLLAFVIFSAEFKKKKNPKKYMLVLQVKDCEKRVWQPSCLIDCLQNFVAKLSWSLKGLTGLQKVHGLHVHMSDKQTSEISEIRDACKISQQESLKNKLPGTTLMAEIYWYLKVFSDCFSWPQSLDTGLWEYFESLQKSSFQFQNLHKILCRV